MNTYRNRDEAESKKEKSKEHKVLKKEVKLDAKEDEAHAKFKPYFCVLVIGGTLGTKEFSYFKC